MRVFASRRAASLADSRASRRGRGMLCRMPRFRVDFHHHCATDPKDVIGYSARALVDAARAHGIDAIALTPHLEPFWDPDAVRHAAATGILLIPGVEAEVEGREVLILNIRPGEVPDPCSFDDLRRLRAALGDRALVIAPHPYYPLPASLGRRLEQHADCFDAVEVAHLHGFGVNPNARAIAWARARGKPLVANSDTHDLAFLGRNYTEVDAERLDAESLFAAIRAGRAIPHTAPIPFFALLRFIFGVIAFQFLARPFRRRRK